MERSHIEPERVLIERCGDAPVYTGPSELLEQLTGFKLTRGVLCAMRRPQLPSVEELLEGASRIAVLEGIVDHTNVGVDLPLGGGARRRRGACDPDVLRPAVPPRCPCFHGHRLPGAVDAHRLRRARLARERHRRSCNAPRLRDGCHGAFGRLGRHRRRHAQRRAASSPSSRVPKATGFPRTRSPRATTR